MIMDKGAWTSRVQQEELNLKGTELDQSKKYKKRKKCGMDY